MKRTATAAIASAVIAALSLIGLGYEIGTAQSGQRVEIRQVDDVASYNDGFMDGKSDCNH